MKDRLAQTAAVLVLEPIFEADLQPRHLPAHQEWVCHSMTG